MLDRAKPMSNIQSHRLEDGPVAVTLLSYGAILQDWRIAHKGRELPVVLGYADASDYLTDSNFMGILAGRVANRIGGAGFSLDGETYQLEANDGPNLLHGGANGLGRQFWDMDAEGAHAVRLHHISPDGAGGFPGRVEFQVIVTLEGYRLTYEMLALPDRPTPISLAQHAYYNLCGGGTIREHQLQVHASRFVPVDGGLVPDGFIAPVTGQAFDFRGPQRICDADPKRSGFDVNLIPDDLSHPVAELRANGLSLKLCSDQPGLQIYTGHGLTGPGQLHQGQTLAPFAGLCLEPQGFPNAVNVDHFPSIIASPEQPYRQVLSIEIAPEEDAI
jgi:aldose 1-epimerase